MSPDTGTIALTGDSIKQTAIVVFAPSSVRTISWNGQSLETIRTQHGSLTATIAGPDTAGLSLPQLGPWKVQDSLPERLPNYSDSGPAWVGKCMPNPKHWGPFARIPADLLYSC